MNFKARTFAAGLVVSLALIAGAPGAAAAQDCAVPSPTQDQYCPSVPPPSTTTDQGSNDPGAPSVGAPSTGSSSGGGLPFTGYDMGMAALAAAALIAAGVGLRRAATKGHGGA